MSSNFVFICKKHKKFNKKNNDMKKKNLRKKKRKKNNKKQCFVDCCKNIESLIKRRITII